MPVIIVDRLFLMKRLSVLVAEKGVPVVIADRLFLLRRLPVLVAISCLRTRNQSISHVIIVVRKYLLMTKYAPTVNIRVPIPSKQSQN